MYRILIFLAIILLGSMSINAAESTKTDPSSGLVIAPGWEIVRANCTACHSAKFITFQRGDRNTWASMIKWMQKTQGLWEFDEKTEKTILDYLASSYPPDKSGRRKPLHPSDLPSYQSSTQNQN